MHIGIIIDLRGQLGLFWWVYGDKREIAEESHYRRAVRFTWPVVYVVIYLGLTGLLDKVLLFSFLHHHIRIGLILFKSTCKHLGRE